ncbi:MAG: CoA transferase [Dehalococcoidia bacterium]|nr:CoA transferase [Dehalococcoidia bacterium]
MAVLEGIKVIDLSQVAAVPLCARYLADFGADVVHIESPRTGDYFRTFLASQQELDAAAPSEFDYLWENYNRNKRGITVDLTQEGGQKLIHRFVEQADVLLTNLRPCEQERYRMDYRTLSRLNPRLVWGCVTGYGGKGPYKDTPAYDASAFVARSGIAHMMSPPGVSGAAFRAAFGDNITALVLTCGILLALFHREKTGVGQEVDTSLLQAGMNMLGMDIAGALATGLEFADWRAEPPPEIIARVEEARMPLAAFYAARTRNPLAGVFATADGRSLLLIALQPDRYWEPICRAVGREDLSADPRFGTFQGRAEHCAELRQALAGTFLTKTLDEWKVLLIEVPFAPYQTLQEAVNDPQARANDFFFVTDHPTQGRLEVLANPINLSKSPASYRASAPEFGQHTEEVLMEHGYTWEDIARFKEQGIIA